MSMINEIDLTHLRRCVTLAESALETSDAPFGSVLVDADGNVRAEDRNRIASVDATRHPEFDLARWAAANMTADERAGATVYTSGEHCPMCSSAHALAGIGRIVYATSAEQFIGWAAELGAPPSPIKMISATEIGLNVTVEGPVAELAEPVRALHVRYYSKN